MRTIESIHSQQMKLSKDGVHYILYSYQLDDGSIVDSLMEFEPGTQVEVWFDEKWNKSKMRKGGKDAVI